MTTATSSPWERRKRKRRREMGMIFQSAALFDCMTVLDNVMFPLNMFSNDTLRDRTRRVMFCLERVNLIEAKAEISRRNQRRNAETRSHCPCHCPKPAILVL